MILRIFQRSSLGVSRFKMHFRTANYPTFSLKISSLLFSLDETIADFYANILSFNKEEKIPYQQLA